VNLAYYGTGCLRYGVRYWPLPGFLHFISKPEMDSFNPTRRTRLYAISVTSLRWAGLARVELYATFDRHPLPRGLLNPPYRVSYPPDTPWIAHRRRHAHVRRSSQILGSLPGTASPSWGNDPNVFVFA